MVSFRYDRVRRNWIAGAALPGFGGLLLVLYALLGGCRCHAPLAVLGGLQIVVAAYLLLQHLRSRASARTELITLVIVLPYCAFFAWRAVANPEPPIRIISGKPVEIRSETRAVYMPDGQVFTYTCWKDEGKGSGVCPAEARWAALPRWPEPAHVRMEVSGSEIHGMVMDDVVIVDPVEFKGEHAFVRVMIVLASLAGAIFLVRGPPHRGRPLPQRRRETPQPAFP
jgi:hypothetical protein